MVDCFQKIIKTEGFGRLYRGLVPPLMLEAPKRAVKFAANDFWATTYKRLTGSEKLTQNLSLLTGMSAGATESIVVVPFELVKIRLQDRNSSYKGPLDVVVKTVKAQGVLGLYGGLESTFWRHVFVIVSLILTRYFVVEWWLLRFYFQNQSHDAQSRRKKTSFIKPMSKLQMQENLLTFFIHPHPYRLLHAQSKAREIVNNFISGSIGGCLGTMVNTPFDVVKSRIQNAVVLPGEKPKYGWTYPAIITIAKEEGVGALYKGFIPRS
ncbi:hypothetical protein PCANC_28390 [Puccinia coronata f. sp. avenae]|uniref:Uncharacterized protein n=1 Tax=Puccinia coronata f. sp. avenae TaxID=200324 RepID=A0A2N5RTT8_9BASI|nr:hypothetical protein PCANC_28390 [Puccinia coronata f. sp. avenae]